MDTKNLRLTVNIPVVIPANVRVYASTSVFLRIKHYLGMSGGTDKEGGMTNG